jgi:hypothetical protein
MTFQPCFLAVEMKERMSAKSVAASRHRNPPEIFCLTFIIREAAGCGHSPEVALTRQWLCCALHFLAEGIGKKGMMGGGVVPADNLSPVVYVVHNGIASRRRYNCICSIGVNKIV